MSGVPQGVRNQLVVFSLDEQRYALPLSAVERVVRAVEITPLPKAPEVVLGVIDVGGRIIPAVDIRKRFRLPARELGLDDRFIIARTSKQRVALVVDSVAGIHGSADGELVSAEEALPFAAYLKGAAKMEDGIVLLLDVDRFLGLDEERSLHAALSEVAG